MYVSNLRKWSITFGPCFYLSKIRLKVDATMMWSRFFYHNCTDEGIRNALDRRHIQSFAELSHVV